MTDQHTITFTPTLRALELKGYAEGVQRLAEQIEIGQAKDATKEQIVAAEQAALALLRNSPIALHTIHSLDRCADEFVQYAARRRDEIMTTMFGPDTE